MPASKNKFVAAESYDFQIADANGAGIIGKLRVKPSSILWKPKGEHKFFSIPLGSFAKWIKRKGKPVVK